MSCIQLEPYGKSCLSSTAEGDNSLLGTTRDVFGGIGLCVELYTCRAYGGGSLDLLQIGGDEDRGTDPPFPKLSDRVAEEDMVGDDIPARTARQRIGCIGDECDLSRRTSPTRRMNSGVGFPSILNSVETTSLSS